MLAARDQENLVSGHHQVAASKPLNQSTKGLQPKTPGNKYPKTPLKVPLNDENVPGGLGGKSGKGKGLENIITGGEKTTFDKNAFVTPMGPRTRAPLGAKTTNAKAKAFQTPAGPAPIKEMEKSQARPSARKPKVADMVKIEVHGDESPLVDRDVEYAPPRPKDRPYESEDFPDGCLNYEPLNKGNLMRGIYKNYHNKIDANGVSRADKELKEGYLKSARKTDEAIIRMLEEEWTVGDVPETFRHLRKKPSPNLLQSEAADQIKRPTALSNKGPTTITSRNAASALSVAPESTVAPPLATKPQPKASASFLSRGKPQPMAPPPSTASTMRHTAAKFASRSTIGYNKGRTAFVAMQTQKPSVPGPFQTQKRQGGMTRSVSNLSQGSDVTITPVRFAQKEGEEESRKLGWLGAFDVEDDELGGGLPECLRREEEDEEEFVMTLTSSG